MTSAERFIEQLSKHGMLSEAIIKRLNDKVANSSSAPSAQALARFLVDKGHLTQVDANDALAASKPPRKKRPRAPKPVEVAAEPKRSSKSRRASAEDDLFADPADASGGGAATEAKPKRKKKYVKKKKGADEFDTPLMLLGGGGLVIGLLLIGGILYLLFAESGDEALADARKAYNAGSYATAVAGYERFVEKFSGHEGRSEARVTLGVARILNLPESSPENRLKKAKDEIPLIEDEEEFYSVREDLASLLPSIAKDLSEKADAGLELAEIDEYVGLTKEALALCSNTNYVPTSLRDEQEFGEIDEVLARIELRQVALKALAETIDAMKAGVASGDTRTAYASHAAFVKAHPEKASDEGLVAAVAETSKAEQLGVRYVEDRSPGLTAEAETAVTAQVAMADRRRKGAAPASGVTVVRFQGNAYAVDRRDGSLRWRRPLGTSLNQLEPVLLGDDCLMVDSSRQEIVRVNAATGALVWRAPIEDDASQPLVLGDRVLAAGKSGRLHVIDAARGDRLGYVQFAQRLRAAPVAAPGGGRLYLVGDHSSVYTLDAEDMSCLGVYYLGHAKGTVVTPPVLVLGRLLVLENDGATTASLHALGVDGEGVVTKELAADDEASVRLNGLVTREPEVFGKRFAVTTESGNIGVYEASQDEGVAAVTLLATRESRRRLRSTPYTAVMDQQLWVAGAGLARYSIQPSGNRLPVRDVAEPFRGDTFVHPLRVQEGVVIHVRRRRGRAGVTIAASDAKTGAVYWETDVAAPAAGPPVALAGGSSFLCTLASGRVFVVDAEALQSGVSERLASPSAKRGGGSRGVVLDAGAESGGAAVYPSRQSGDAVGVDAATQPRLMQLPGALNGQPIRFAGGWLAGLASGQVACFDGLTGDAVAAPFQPELAPRQTIKWSEPALAEVDGEPVGVITDGRANLYALRLLPRPAPHLAPLSVVELEQQTYASRVAVAGGKVAVATSDDRLNIYELEGLSLSGEYELAAPVVWGPYHSEGVFLLATADDALLAIDPSRSDQPVWTESGEGAGLAGPPAVDSGVALFARREGVFERRRLTDGTLVDRAPIGQSIASPLTAVDGRLLVASRDGALLFVQPSRAE
ncbi:MAG: PQQ-binding-like beta-propeller repeat protein [Planctomycetota bacterium]